MQKCEVEACFATAAKLHLNMFCIEMLENSIFAWKELVTDERQCLFLKSQGNFVVLRFFFFLSWVHDGNL